MKTPLLFILMVVLCTGTLLAQNNIQRTQQRPATLPPPLPTRQVSGIVKDKSDATLPGAVVKLESPKDTMSTATNADGVFIFKNVKSATFVLSVSSLGYKPQVKKMLNNDAIPRLTLDPVVLESATTQLKEVVVNGTPSIVYKQDTVEYRASDYKVRENATVDELLKKMEGMEVGSDGTLTHQGQQVMKAKLNGKEYSGGDVAQAIQNLPADIVEKIQIVDDYGDQAAHSGIKDGDPQKVLNITTRADRSVGTTGRLTGQAGNNDRYNAQLFVQRINANQQIGVIANFRNTVTGVASTGLQGGGGSGNPGTTQSFSPSINYRDQLTKKVEITSSITYGFTKNNSVSQSYGLRNSNAGQNLFNNSGSQQRNTFRRGANFEIDYNIDSLNYLQIQPSYSYSTSDSYNTSLQDNNNDYIDSLGNHTHEHQNVSRTTSNKTPNTSYGAIVLFNHRFRTPGRNFSFQVNYNHNDTQSNGETVSDTRNYADSSFNTVISDLPAHNMINRKSITNTFRASMTYSEPLSKVSRLEVNAQTQHNSHDTDNQTDSLLATPVKTTNLIYNYATTETRIAFNYRYNNDKVNLSLGTTLVPYNLQGNKLDNTSHTYMSSSINYFRVLPIFQFRYNWSRTHRFSIRYQGSNQEPTFDQIQPFTDYTDPNNIIVGNPNLNVGLTNGVSVTYDNYFPNSRFNISFNGALNLYKDQVTTNSVTKFDTITAIPLKLRSYKEIHYVNMSGARSVQTNYNISKQLDDRRYNLALNGRVNYNYDLGMSDSIAFHQTSWSMQERFGPRISPTDNIDVNPFFANTLRRTFATSKLNPTSKQVTNAFGIDGRFYFFKTFQVHYDAQKQFIHQSISDDQSTTGARETSTNSPLVIDAGFQKEFGARRQFTLTFDVFDILHQNNYINQDVSVSGVTNTLSSSLSRYFLIGFRLNLQKWSGRPMRGGKEMKRRGDGSFIYN